MYAYKTKSWRKNMPDLAFPRTLRSLENRQIDARLIIYKIVHGWCSGNGIPQVYKTHIQPRCMS